MTKHRPRELGGPETIGNFGDFAQSQPVIIVERGSTREFWSLNGTHLGTVGAHDHRLPEILRQAHENLQED